MSEESFFDVTKSFFKLFIDLDDNKDKEIKRVKIKLLEGSKFSDIKIEKNEEDNTIILHMDKTKSKIVLE